MGPTVVFCHFCEIHGPTRVFRTDRVPLNVKIEPTVDRSTCEGCSFDAKGLEGYVWTDSQASVKYVSSPCSPQFPDDNVIRQSCIRSLSCEVYPEGREGVVYFGDDQRAHVLSNCFVLKDSTARGFQRTYSFLVIHTDRYSLLSSWSYYVDRIDQLIRKLKSKANSVYEKEVSLSQNPGAERRSIRLESALQVAGRGRNANNTQRSESRARPLVEITDDTTIFALLHLNMSIILKDSSPPCPTASATRLDHPFLTRNAGHCLRKLYSQSSGIGRKNFLHCAYNLLIGKQIVLRCDCIDQAHKILLTLSNLLPSSGVKVSFDCDRYYGSSICNLLHVKNNVPLPTEANVLLLESLGSNDEKVVISSDQMVFPDRIPSFLVSLDQVLSDTQYSDACVTCYLDNLKHEWTSKSRLSVALKTATISSMKVLGIAEADNQLVQFWRTFV